MAARTGPTCGADRRNNMGPCGQPAGWHTDHPGVGRCSWHGGNAPNGVKAAAREIVDEQARRVLARMDAPPCTNPFAALPRLAGEAEAWRATCAYLLNKLGEDELRYSGQVGGLKAEQVRAEVTMYSNAISQSASILTGLAKLDIETAWQALEQAKAAMVADAFHAALTGAGLAPERAALVSADFVRRLRVFSDEDERADEVLSGVVIPPGRTVAVPAVTSRP
jgi:hypothetical protein